MKEEREKRQDITLLSTKAIDSHYLLNLPNVQWARIALNKTIIATENKAWLYQPHSIKDSFAQPMEGTGSITTTKNLLDGAIAAAEYIAESKIKPQKLTPIGWVRQLAEAYHLSCLTPELIGEACIGFAVVGRWSLAEWAAYKAHKEEGYARLALRDIQYMGYDAEAVVEEIVSPTAVALTDYLTRSVCDWNPIDCVGYCYTIERLTADFKEEYIDRVKALLSPEINATRNMRVHDSASANIEFVEMVAELTASERTRVAIACYETASIYFSQSIEDCVSDEELQQILEPLRIVVTPDIS